MEHIEQLALLDLDIEIRRSQNYKMSRSKTLPYDGKIISSSGKVYEAMYTFFYPIRVDQVGTRLYQLEPVDEYDN